MRLLSSELYFHFLKSHWDSLGNQDSNCKAGHLLLLIIPGIFAAVVGSMIWAGEGMCKVVRCINECIHCQNTAAKASDVANSTLKVDATDTLEDEDEEEEEESPSPTVPNDALPTMISTPPSPKPAPKPWDTFPVSYPSNPVSPKSPQTPPAIVKSPVDSQNSSEGNVNNWDDIDWGENPADHDGISDDWGSQPLSDDVEIDLKADPKDKIKQGVKKVNETLVQDSSINSQDKLRIQFFVKLLQPGSLGNEDLLQILSSYSGTANREETLSALNAWMIQYSSANLTKQAMGGVPQQLFLFQELKTLVLENNNLENLSGFSGQFKKLETLKLGHNHLKQVPPEIQQYQSLKTLSLAYNHLNALPHWIAQMPALTHLDISHNPVKLSTTLAQQLVDNATLTNFNCTPAQIANLPQGLKKQLQLKLPNLIDHLEQLQSL